MMRLVCASANPDKVAEITALLDGVAELLPRPAHVPDVVEDAGTLIGNAWLKARAIRDATGLAAVADDSGLFVDALDGRPGVETAYFAGPHATYAQNRAKLLHEMRDVKVRSASFRSLVLVAFTDRRPLAVEGVCPGFIALDERGSRGFGYDPLFIPDGGGGRTFAEMTDDEKHALSHRGRAFHALARALASVVDGR